MKASDRAALAIGAVGTWIYIGGVDSDLWGRAALGAGMFLLALVAKKIGDYVEECREEQEEREEERRDTGKMTALRNAGWSYEKIADEMGCSAGTVWNFFNKDKEDKKDVSENQ